MSLAGHDGSWYFRDVHRLSNPFKRRPLGLVLWVDESERLLVFSLFSFDAAGIVVFTDMIYSYRNDEKERSGSVF